MEWLSVGQAAWAGGHTALPEGHHQIFLPSCCSFNSVSCCCCSYNSQCCSCSPGSCSFISCCYSLKSGRMVTLSGDSGPGAELGQTLALAPGLLHCMCLRGFTSQLYMFNVLLCLTVHLQLYIFKGLLGLNIQWDSLLDLTHSRGFTA